jgi:hypothetical protein
MLDREGGLVQLAHDLQTPLAAHLARDKQTADSGGEFQPVRRFQFGHVYKVQDKGRFPGKQPNPTFAASFDICEEKRYVSTSHIN